MFNVLKLYAVKKLLKAIKVIVAQFIESECKKFETVKKLSKVSRILASKLIKW